MQSNQRYTVSVNSRLFLRYTELGTMQDSPRSTVDFLLAYDWPYDAPFIRLLEGEFRPAGPKTNLPWEFIRAGVYTPHTIPIPALRQMPVLDERPDISPLGVPFSVKPDLGGGGWGVVTDARDWSDVENARRKLPDDDLILQQFVTPALLDGRRAWFRILY